MMITIHILLLILFVLCFAANNRVKVVQGFTSQRFAVDQNYGNRLIQQRRQTQQEQQNSVSTIQRRQHYLLSSILKSTTSESSQITDTSNQQEQDRNSNNSNKDDPEWKFFDTARINVSGGDGGDGCVAFRREKGEARGGPNGGRGGPGGSVYIQGSNRINTLQTLRQRIHIRGTNGKNGIGKNKDGSAGNDVIIRVPIGTVVRDMMTQKFAGEVRYDGDTIIVAKGGRGGRGNFAFMTNRRTAPKIMERGEPGSTRWLSIELKLVADVGIIGKPNAGKSTLLASVSNARPKIANYPFTTIVPNLGVCDLFDDSDSGTKNTNNNNNNDDDENDTPGTGLVLCDIPGLIEGASKGIGMGYAFLRHVQRCRVLLHVIDGTSDDPVQDYITIQDELKSYDDFLSQKVQVIVINKIDVPGVAETLNGPDGLIEQLKQISGHTRVVSISAATKDNVRQLMYRLRKLVQAQPVVDVLPPVAEIDLSKAGLEYDSTKYTIVSDPQYPGQWRIEGQYIEHVAKMTHWEYPEAVERFGRQLIALGISDELVKRGASDGDLIMIDQYDFDFSPGMTNPYIPMSLLEDESIHNAYRSGPVQTSISSKEYQQRMKDNIFYNDGPTEQDEWMATQKATAAGARTAASNAVDDNDDDDFDLDDDEAEYYYLSEDDFDEDGNLIQDENDEVFTM